MGWIDFIEKAAATGLRVAEGAIDPDIKKGLGSRVDIVSKIAEQAKARTGVAIKLGELYYNAKTLIALYEAANADGKWTMAEINAFVDGLQAIVDDVDEIL